jgi:hypothetical protein
VADDGVVGAVDLGRQPLGFGAFASVGETVGMVAFDQLPALAMNLLDGRAWIEAKSAVGGEYVERIFSRDEARSGGAPVPFAATRRSAFCVLPPGCMVPGRLFVGAFFFFVAFFCGLPLLGGPPPGCGECPPEGVFEGFPTLATATEGLSEAVIVLKGGYEAPGETPKATRDAHEPRSP